ncbi:MAG: hypothetical protein JWO13_1782 [Acidobacteriales bacterium]|nr:hypothetical protein [Terriglobales bacterium]
MSSKLGMLALWCALSTFAIANDYYVSPVGKDTSTGNRSSSSVKTISHAASLAHYGDTIHVAPGTYFENVVSNATGISFARIVFVSDTKWAAKIIGSGCKAFAPTYNCDSHFNAVWHNKGDFVDIVGFDISGDGHIGIQNDGSDVNEVENHVHGIAGPGACIGYTGGIAGIDNTNANRNPASLKNNNVLRNWIHDIGWDGKHFCGGGGHGIYQASPGGKVQNNLVYKGSGQGITMWHHATNIVITNNTIFQFNTGIILGADPATGASADNCIVSNNIIRNVVEDAVHETGTVGMHNTISNNLTYENGGKDYQLGNGHRVLNSVNANPLFTDWKVSGTGDYHLTAGSPAIDSGAVENAPLDDFDGVARPEGKAFDRGAYEFVRKSTKAGRQ